MGQLGDQGRVANGKAEAQACEAPEFAETFQDDRVGAGGVGDQRGVGGDVTKAFVDDGGLGEFACLPLPPVGVVGVYDNAGFGVVGYGPTLGRKGAGVFVVGRAGNVDGAGRGDAGHAGDKGAGTGGG